MGATYQDPSASDKDAVRFRIGDTYTADAYLSDEEIQYCLAQKGGDVLQAAMLAIQMVVAQLAFDAGNESVGPVSEGGTQSAIDALMKAYANIQSELGLTAMPIFTGQTVAEKVSPDFGFTRPAFRRPLFPGNNPDSEFVLREPAFGYVPIELAGYPLLLEEDE